MSPSMNGPTCWTRQPPVVCYPPLYYQHQRCKVLLLLKASIQVLAFLELLIMGWYFMQLRPCIGVCIRVHHTDAKDTHHYGILESENTSIPPQVRNNLPMLHIRVSTTSPSLSASSPYRWVRLPSLCNPMDFGFVGNCSQGVICPTHLIPLLLHKSASEAN